MEENEDSDANGISYGGVIRTTTKKIFEKFVSPSGNLIPKIRPTKTAIVKSVDGVTNLIDGVTVANNVYYGEKKTRGLNDLRSRLIKELPGYIKGSIAGTILFSSYEYLSFGNQYHPYRLQQDQVVIPILKQSVSGGLFSGVLSGIFISYFENIIACYKNKVKEIGERKVTFRERVVYGTKSILLGTSLTRAHAASIAANGFIYSFTFSVYESSKFALFKYCEEPLVKSIVKSSFLLASVSNRIKSDGDSEGKTIHSTATSLFVDSTLFFIAGAASGLVTEYLTHITNPLTSLNEKTIRSPRILFQVLKSNALSSTPTLRNFIMTSVTYGLGFIVYEFGLTT